MRATEDITIKLHSQYSAGHEKPVSLTILFCSQPESGWRLCEPLPPRLYLTLLDDCRPQTPVSTTLATASSSAARQTHASTSSTRRIPYPTRHHRTTPPSLNSHIASIYSVDSSEDKINNRSIPVPSPTPPQPSVPILDILVLTLTPPPQPSVPQIDVNTATIPATTSNQVVEEKVSCSGYESDLDQILELLK